MRTGDAWLARSSFPKFGPSLDRSNIVPISQEPGVL